MDITHNTLLLDLNSHRHVLENLENKYEMNSVGNGEPSSILLATS